MHYNPITDGPYTVPYATNNLGAMFGIEPSYSSSNTAYWNRNAAGKFTPFSFPSGTSLVDPYYGGCGLNDAGQMSGTLSAFGAFLYQAGKYTNVSFPNLQGTYQTNGGGLNGQEQTVGYYYDGTRYHGFSYSSADGWNTLDYPGAANTYLIRINSNGEILGYTISATGAYNYFILSAGAWADIPLPSGDGPLASFDDFDDLTGATGYAGFIGRTH